MPLRFSESPEQNGKIPDRQLTLFSHGWTWQELPRDVRREVVNVLATLCVEILLETPPTNQEFHHESSRH